MENELGTFDGIVDNATRSRRIRISREGRRREHR